MLKDVLKLNALGKVGGGSGGVSSWNDLTDKPFYKEMGEGALFSKSKVEITDGQAVINYVGLQAGKTYIVKEGNGGEVVSYECVAQMLTLEEAGTFVAIGNIGAATGGDDTGDPFLILDAPEQGLCLVMDLLGRDYLNNFEIVGEGEIIYPLAPEFVSDGLVKIVDFGEISSGSYTPVVRSRRFGEDDFYISHTNIYFWQKMGYQIVGRLEGNGGVILFQLSESNPDKSCFTCVKTDSVGIRVYSMQLDGAACRLSVFDVSATLVDTYA